MSISSESLTLTLAVRRRANQAGQTWAGDVKLALESERRRPCGGWPGTLSEARARVAASVFPRIAPAGEAPPTLEQVEDAARLVYAAARAAWLEQREPEEEA